MLYVHNLTDIQTHIENFERGQQDAKNSTAPQLPHDQFYQEGFEKEQPLIEYPEQD